jgi:intracellular sulfur oxidation DsrE/DsrF family protein
MQPNFLGNEEHRISTALLRNLLHVVGGGVCLHLVVAYLQLRASDKQIAQYVQAIDNAACCSYRRSGAVTERASRTMETVVVPLKQMETKMKRTTITATMVTLLMLFTVGLASAADEATRKPFAERHVVLQISDDSVSTQSLVLNVANNLLSHYGPDKVDVEIVAFGPGLNLLVAGNPNEQRIKSLVSQGEVRFAACLNTFSNMTRQLGYEPELTPHAMRVSAGVARILDLTTEGYTLIKP